MEISTTATGQAGRRQPPVPYGDKGMHPAWLQTGVRDLLRASVQRRIQSYGASIGIFGFVAGGRVINIAKFPDRRSMVLTDNSRCVLEDRYLRRDESGNVVEVPEEMFRRVAREIAYADIAFEGPEAARRSEQEFFELMRDFEFLPNSPTLMNAGRNLQQLSACFVVPVEDSLDSIFEAVKHTAMIHKSGGGTGFSFSRIRPNGDSVRTTCGVASGPVSFMQVFDAATEAVKQGGMRRGANMGVLRVDHPDILDFIDAKATGAGLVNFNISVAVTDVFMESVRKGYAYPLVHPGSGATVGHLKAPDVFRRICQRAWQTGEPGLIFIDAVNRDNPTPELGPLECTNPCGEQPLLPYESCNLGSINVARMTKPGRRGSRLDYRRLARTVRVAVHFLDNVIEVNRYPVPQIESVTRGNRKIGLGIMGWADLLIELGLPYGSHGALALAGKVMGFIQKTSHQASEVLARRRGPFPNFRRGGRLPAPRRNATVTTIAPAGTISMIAGCSGGIEPLFALSFTRSNILGGRVFKEAHPGLLKDLKESRLWSHSVIRTALSEGSIQQLTQLPGEMRALYQTALEIAPEWHVRMQAAFQKHCDNAVSKTVNLPFAAGVEDVERIYTMAHILGCKGITVYRDRSRTEQVLTAGCAVCQ